MVLLTISGAKLLLQLQLSAEVRSNSSGIGIVEVQDTDQEPTFSAGPGFVQFTDDSFY